MNESHGPSPPISVDKLRDEFANALQAGKRPSIEDYLARVTDSQSHTLFHMLLRIELSERCRYGEQPTPDEYRTRFPKYFEIIEELFSTETTIDKSVDQSEAEPQSTDDSSVTASHHETPTHIGRFEIRETLGEGGFGTVYLAHDSELDRLVALKVPRKDRFKGDQDIEKFIEEARTAARLKHSGIVAVHDVVQGGDGIFVVQEYVAGESLTEAIRSKGLTVDQSVMLLTELAEAIAYAHREGLVHRDLKPANILLDESGHIHVADFGLAVHESVQRRRKGERAGTPAYMAPEQVRGETHRLDGRTDIWAIGVIFYQMLTSRRPFAGDSQEELFDEVRHRDPRPPRQLDHTVPTELERICLKCLSKKMTDRYGSAIDMAEDLRHWGETKSGSSGAEHPDSVAPVKIVPKGLRAFDENDADFFLDLLPGPRDRDGLPESIRFWKTKIEERDPDKTFAVGLMYGPSGCGKSSLVKAGLLPRLDPNVIPIFFEATAVDTDNRLVTAIRKKFQWISPDSSLPDVLCALRESSTLRSGQKVLIVMDQFEQWLHAEHDQHETDLVHSLRQCDGQHLQCVVLVRDEFWLSVSRFLAELEVDIIQGHNTKLVDLFDLIHARHTLTEFGIAYGRLPDRSESRSREEELFVKQAVGELAEGDKVICVRLSLFAEMVKDKPWEPETLRSLGGARGIGVMYLEETFCSRSAPPSHRQHQQAAIRVLKALLPPVGINLRRYMLSQKDLVEVSGYKESSRNMNELLRILDSETRLVTPTTPDVNISDESVWPATFRQYQLTHDFLVSSLRSWIREKQESGWIGRAQICLEERTNYWIDSREKRFLPTRWEYWRIRFGVRKRRWTPRQNELMGEAGKRERRFAVKLLILAAFLFVPIPRRSAMHGRMVFDRRTPVFAAEDSVITSIAVVNGQRIDRGTPIMRVVDPSDVDLSPNDVSTYVDNGVLESMDDGEYSQVLVSKSGGVVVLGPNSVGGARVGAGEHLADIVHTTKFKIIVTGPALKLLTLPEDWKNIEKPWVTWKVRRYQKFELRGSIPEQLKMIGNIPRIEIAPDIRRLSFDFRRANLSEPKVLQHILIGIRDARDNETREMRVQLDEPVTVYFSKGKAPLVAVFSSFLRDFRNALRLAWTNTIEEIEDSNRGYFPEWRR